MSIKLMAAAWELDIPQTEKMVLLCLCDHANDDGECWPSVARMARKCSVSQRTVQRAIQSLKDKSILDWHDVPGRSHKFTIDPRRIVTPDTVSPLTMTTKPPTQCHPTPDTVSPKPSITIKEPSKVNRVAKPEGVTDEVWDDWRRVRKTPITATVLKRMETEAAKIGWTLAEAITEAAGSSWQGFKADWVSAGRGQSRGASLAEIGDEVRRLYEN
jgi:hypothetical protein